MKITTVNNNKIFRIFQGTGQLGGFFEPNYQNDNKIINSLSYGIDLGFNGIDTAQNYGGGHTEEIVGKVIKNQRENIFLSTKVDIKNYDIKNFVKSVDKSLKRLKTDYIDLIQTHWPDPNHDTEKLINYMIELKNIGKIRYYGLGNPRLEELQKITKRKKKISFIQTEYNLLERSIEKKFFSLCNKNNIFILGWSPLLSGRILENKRKKKILLEISKKYGFSIEQLMISWIINNSSVYPVCRSINKKHLDLNFIAKNQIEKKGYKFDK